MNENSVICKFMAEHPEDWEIRLHKDYDLRVKKDGDLVILNYEIVANFHDPIVQEARGIIIDFVKLEVVCWPFRKFGNHSEGYADEIDWSSARVLEKVDGSIIKLWFDEKKGDWQFSTNGTIRAENANVDGYVGAVYADVIRVADNYGDIPFEKLDKNSTYIFELVSPETRVVVKYEKASLYHLGTRNNLTGQEYETDIGIKKPKSYPLANLADCLNAAVELNKGTGQEVEKEGFVVVDKFYRRVKIKSPDYVTEHHLATMRSIPKKECLRILLEDRDRLDVLMEKCPDFAPTLKFYDYKLCELFHQADEMGVLAKSLYKEFSGDRGAVARVVSSHALAFAAFHCLSHPDKTGRSCFEKMPMEKLCKYIPDYQREDIVATLWKKSGETDEN